MGKFIHIVIKCASCIQKTKKVVQFAQKQLYFDIKSKRAEEDYFGDY